MRKVIDIEETTLDIIFRNDQPSAVVSEGSVFNGVVSSEHVGVSAHFISETGNDHVGNIILQFVRDNYTPTDRINVFPDGKSPVPLAFPNKHSDAKYIFYKDHPKQRLDVLFLPISENDIIVIGPYYALDSVLCDKILELLDTVRKEKAIVYCDPNFRSSHKNEIMKSAPAIIEDLEYADIAGGSLGDFYYICGIKDTEKIYKDRVKFYCPPFLRTAGAERISLRINAVSKEYPVTLLQAISTVGAGDSFNADLIYGMLKYGVRYHDLQNLSEKIWDRVIQCGQDFSAETRKSSSSSVSEEFAVNYR